MTTTAEIAFRQLQAKDRDDERPTKASKPQEARGRPGSATGFRGARGLVETLASDLQLRNWETVSVCCFKPPPAVRGCGSPEERTQLSNFLRPREGRALPSFTTFSPTPQLLTSKTRTSAWWAAGTQ